jgi:hypothetical protein
VDLSFVGCTLGARFQVCGPRRAVYCTETGIQAFVLDGTHKWTVGMSGSLGRELAVTQGRLVTLRAGEGMRAIALA